MKYILKVSTALLASLFVVLLLLSAGTASAEPALPTHTITNRLSPVTPIQVQSSSITNFRATSSRTRGRIDLSWYYTGRAFTGYFVVERSSNGSSWRSVAACALKYGGDVKSAYTCADTGLASGTTYTYRACLPSKGNACSTSSATKPVSVKAP